MGTYHKPDIEEGPFGLSGGVGSSNSSKPYVEGILKVQVAWVARDAKKHQKRK